MGKMNNIKCPRCQSNHNTPLANTFYHCLKCGNNYYSDVGNGDGLIVQSSKSAENKSDLSSKLKYFIPACVIGVLAVYFVLPLIHPNNNDVPVTNVLAAENDDDTADTDTILKPWVENGYPRVAYVFYHDRDSNENYLYKANFLTHNRDPDDQNVVSIKSENDELVGYDSLSGEVIPNFTQLVSTPFSADAAVLYVDNDNIIVKNKIESGYQLEMVSAYSGQIIWTLSNKELPGLDILPAYHLANEGKSIELFRNNFRIKLTPNYYIVDKKGQVIGYGKLN